MKKYLSIITVVIALTFSSSALAADAGVTDAAAEVAASTEVPAGVETPSVAVPSVAVPSIDVAETASAGIVNDSAIPALSRVMSHVIELLAALLMLLLGLLVKKATSYFTKKTNIEVPARTEKLMAAWSGKAVNYAAEKAHQYNKEKGEKMKGPEKLEVALGFGLSLAEEYGLTNIAKDKLTKHIEAYLGEER